MIDESKDYCIECDCILTSYESEHYCQWCEERMSAEITNGENDA
jgi:hypothetical protein